MADVTLDDILARHAGGAGALLPLLHEVQATFGCVTAQAEAAIADALNLTRAEVHGVVSFYHDFRPQADARPVLKLCRAEACQARGSDALAAAVAIPASVRVETVYCLGLCSVGPNALVGDVPHARLDAGKLAALLGSLA